MALFVNVDNQTILWEILQQQPEVQGILHPEAWFKSHIKSFYESLDEPWFRKPLTTAQLNDLNRRVLHIMMNDLRRGGGAAAATPTLDRPSGDRRGMRAGTGDDGMHQQFLQKQREMESMLHAPVPQNIDFKLSELDEPLTNIDELVQRQLQERQALLQTPPPVAPPPPPAVTATPERPRLTFAAPAPDDAPPTLDIQTVPIPPEDIPPMTMRILDEEMRQIRQDLKDLRHELQERVRIWERMMPGADLESSPPSPFPDETK